MGPRRASKGGDLLFVLVALAITVASAVAADPSGEGQKAVVLGQIEMPGQAAGIIANPRRGEMVVAGEFGLTLIDVATSAVRRIRLGGAAGPVVVSPDGTVIYTTLPVAQRVLAVAATSGEVLWYAAVSGFPWEVAITPDGKRLYVTQQLQGEAAGIDTTTHEVRSLAEMGIRAWPMGITVSPDGKRIYVPSLGETKIFDAESYQEVGRFPVREKMITFSRDGSEIYLTGDGLVAVDPTQGSERWSLGAGINLTGPVISADGRSAYLYDRDELGLVSVDLESHRICQRRVLAEPMRRFALSGDGSRIFAIMSTGTIFVIDAREFACGVTDP